MKPGDLEIKLESECSVSAAHTFTLRGMVPSDVSHLDLLTGLSSRGVNINERVKTR